MILPGREAIIKRLPTRIDRTQKIQKFDSDNCYPQRALETMYRSYTLNGIINKLSGFTNGEGFVDLSLNSIIVSDDEFKKQTLKHLLGLICLDYSWADGFALHINYNLNYTISSITHIPFEYCRLGLPDDDGNVNSIAYCTNWESDYMKEFKDRKIVFYNRFNPFVVEDEVKECGGIEEYKGQVFYFTPNENQYPKTTFDSVWEHAQTQYEISLFGLNNVVNGFTAGHIFLYPGKFETDDEAYAFKKRMQEHKGAMGANSMMVIEAGTGDIKGSDLLIKTEVSNNDKLFEFTLNWIEKAMLQCYGMPSEIIGKLPDTGLFNKQQIEDSYTYFNSVTRDRRNTVSEQLSFIFQFWSTPIQSEFIITPQVYDIGSITANDPKDVNDNLKNLSGRQSQNLFRIVRQYSQQKITLEQAQTLLKGGYGFTDEEINQLLGITDNGG